MLSAMIWDLRGNYNPFWMKLQCKEPPSEGQTELGVRIDILSSMQRGGIGVMRRFRAL